MKRSTLLHFSQLPKWLQDNPDIHFGYRPPFYSYTDCFKSLLYLHNEWGNIYSHLLPSLYLFLAIFFVGSTTPFSGYLNWWSNELIYKLEWDDIVVISIFLLSGVICLGCSAIFHAFSCHSPHACMKWNKLDYAGIAVLIGGSSCPSLYYAFYCSPIPRYVYIGSVAVIGFLTAWAMYSPRFHGPQHRRSRTLLFLAMSLSGFLPICHALIGYGWEYSNNAIQLKWMIVMGAIYGFGAYLYVSRYMLFETGFHWFFSNAWDRIPESIFPGRFDYFFHSHQLFHVCVVLGFFVNWYRVMKACEWWHQVENICRLPVSEILAL